MNSEKRLFAAIALSILIILSYQAYMRKFAKPYQQPVDVIDTVDVIQEPAVTSAARQMSQKTTVSPPKFSETIINIPIG